jgi:very-short-patch-repair endonuclease
MPFLVSKSGGGGLSYDQTRRVTLRTPTRGVRTEAGATDWLDDVRAVALTLPVGAVFSHVTAAQLLGIPLAHDDTRPLHVTVPRGGRRGSRTAIAWHIGLLTGERTIVRGLPVTVAHRTWRDLGPMMDMPRLVAAADVIVRRSLASIDQLSVPPGCRGAHRLRAALPLIDPRSRSVRESLLRVRIHQRGLPDPQINFDVIEDGGWIGCGDMVWTEYRLVLEYDGDHHAQRRQRHQDAQTRNDYAEYGWKCLVFTAKHFERLDESVDQVARVLRQRGWPGPDPV